MRAARLVLVLIATATLLVVGLAAPAQAAPPSYVALGDSYSSGVGTRSYLNDGSSCQRSVYAYPSLIAAAKRYALNFRACSGATVADVTNGQLSALSAANAYVTISVGGNDAGFASVLTTCAQPSWLSNCIGAVNGAQRYIAITLPGSLQTLYASIRAKAPNAKVVVVGYPGRQPHIHQPSVTGGAQPGRGMRQNGWPDGSAHTEPSGDTRRRAPRPSTCSSAAATSSTMTSWWICCGRVGSPHTGARWSGASWNAIPEWSSCGATTTKSSDAYVTGWPSTADQNRARPIGSGVS